MKATTMTLDGSGAAALATACRYAPAPAGIAIQPINLPSLRGIP